MTMAFDFDAPAGSAAPAARTWTQAQLAWSELQLDESLSNNKTRLKVLKADASGLREVLDAVLLVAKAKADAMARAASGKDTRPADALFNWVGKRSDMAEASVVLAHALVAETDISALPRDLA